ncbi:MAG: dethiobiotin synthase [Oleiphilaceae bacterium]|nr:dethiobiotin synthase [Oleiphilaceae bacterium]
MAKRFFVTGTDTEVGKTFASCALLAAAQKQGLATIGLKPFAAGGEEQGGKLVNEDAIALQQAASIKLPYEQVNPVLLNAATSPHIAAHLEGRQISVGRVQGIVQGALMQRHDFAIVEGAGGWRVPVSPRESVADLARQLAYPVILVVGLRLGCINHALLTVEAIARDGLPLAGWIANSISPEPMNFEREYLDTLKAAINAPLIGHLPFNQEARNNPELLAESVNLSCLNL